MQVFLQDYKSGGVTEQVGSQPRGIRSAPFSSPTGCGVKPQRSVRESGKEPQPAAANAFCEVSQLMFAV
jgi:hypothetical protein